MLDWFSTALHLSEFSWLAIVDIAILTWLIYLLLLRIQGTRAAQAIAGLILVIFVHFITGPGLIHLRTIHDALGYLLLYIPFAIIVLFQNPIRQALARFGWQPLAAFLRRRGREPLVDEVALAATSLASKRIGALIVIERKLGLRAFYETGIVLDALVSYDLLMNIFTPGSPLHDGAVIIAEGRIKAASSYLPLTTDPDLSRTYGTRHRAAIGITQETDSIAVVVSEERSVVSLAEEGRIIEDLSAHELADLLAEALYPGDEGRERKDQPEAAVVDTTHA